jgi:hypothetical protein
MIHHVKLPMVPTFMLNHTRSVTPVIIKMHLCENEVCQDDLAVRSHNKIPEPVGDVALASGRGASSGTLHIRAVTYNHGCSSAESCRMLPSLCCSHLKSFHSRSCRTILRVSVMYIAHTQRY